jgi:hypothetical protein
MKSLTLLTRLALLIIVFSVYSCTSTHLVSSWRNPETTVDVNKLHKVWAMCLVKDETTRRVAEDELAKRMPGVIIPSYTKFPSSALKNNPESVNAAILESGYDGIIIMRLMSKEQQTSYVQGSYPSYYGGWYGYYGYSAPYYYDPGYYQTDEYYSVETNIYSLNPDKLIWTGITETMNPNSAETTIKEIADAIAYQMKSEKFLVKTDDTKTK